MSEIVVDEAEDKDGQGFFKVEIEVELTVLLFFSVEDLSGFDIFFCINFNSFSILFLSCLILLVSSFKVLMVA